MILPSLWYSWNFLSMSYFIYIGQPVIQELPWLYSKLHFHWLCYLAVSLPKNYFVLNDNSNSLSFLLEIHNISRKLVIFLYIKIQLHSRLPYQDVHIYTILTGLTCICVDLFMYSFDCSSWLFVSTVINRCTRLSTSGVFHYSVHPRTLIFTP